MAFCSFYTRKTEPGLCGRRSPAMLAWLQLCFGGAVAQLGARLDGIEEVVGSNPIGSTNVVDGSR